MNSKIPSKKATLAKSLKDIPAAYDIAAALLECREKGLIARRAIAWMEGGRVQVSLNEKFLKQRIARNLRDKIYQRWCAELKITFTEPNQPLPPQATGPEPRLARCVAFSNGADWSASKEIDIYHFLSNPLGTPRDRGFSIIPLEYPIFSTEMSDAVWMVKHDTGPLQRCLAFGWTLLSEVARVYCLGVEFIDGFEQDFDSTEKSDSWTLAPLPAALLHDCKKATLKMIISIALMDWKKPKQNPDAGVALQQGFLIGKKLALAEGIISNAKDIKLARQQGVSGQHTSNFWTSVLKLHAASPKGTPAYELFYSLDGQPDPDSRGKKLQIVEDKLIRGKGKAMDLRTFQASLSRAKSRARKKASSEKN